MVLSTFFQASAPPNILSTFFRLAGNDLCIWGDVMGWEYGQVVQAKMWVEDSDMAEDEVIIWRRVPSRGQNHMVLFIVFCAGVFDSMKGGSSRVLGLDGCGNCYFDCCFAALWFWWWIRALML